MALTIIQTPDELLDWTIDWSTRGLGTDTIASSAWVVSPTGPTLSAESFTATTSTFWLTGGTAGNIYEITNTVVTAGGRTLQETITYLSIAERTN